MALTFKSSSVNIGTDWTTAYTVPPGKAATVISALIANYSGSNSVFSVGYRRSGVVYPLVTGVNVNTSSTSSMLPGKVELMASDELVMKNALAVISNSVSAPGITGYTTGSIYNVIGNGAVLIVVAANGIYRSADEGSTWSQVSSITSTVTKPWLINGSTIYIYTSATTAVRSTDNGVTWSSGYAVTNAPTVLIDRFGSIIKVSTTYYGLNTSTQMVSTTDGVTWSNYGVAITAASASLCWTGTNWVAGASASASVYISPAGASWTTVATGLSSGSVDSMGLVSNGAGTVLVASGTSGIKIRASFDHGATWADASGDSTTNSVGGAVQNMMYVNGRFLLKTNSGNQPVVSQTGVSGSWVNLYANVFSNTPCAVTTNYLWLGGVTSRTADLSFSTNFGSTGTVSVMEVS